MRIRLRGIGIKRGKGGVEILSTASAQPTQICRQCKKNERKSGSARCGECSTRYVVQRLNSEKLERKIAGSN